MKNNSHGGNIYKKAKELGLSESQLMDFSANISSLGLPEHIRKAMTDAIEGTIHYPDPDCTDLKEAIAAQDGVRPEYITCGNGGADLLYRLAFGLMPKKVLLPVPAFVEYEEACTAAGAEMVYYRMGKDLMVHEDFLECITEDIDLVILCNPNNPTGLLTPRDLILKILDKAQENHCMVMVDECFLEICAEEEKYTLKSYISPGGRPDRSRECNSSRTAQYDNLIILKSFTKLYAIPGVRLGYIISANPWIIDKLNRAGQAWSVSHIAQQAGIAALKHPDYKQAVIKEVEKELAYMKQELSRLPIELYDGQANYLFFRTPGITDLDIRMEKYGIMIRNCSNYVNLGRDYWRVAVKDHQENRKLIETIRICILMAVSPQW